MRFCIKGKSVNRNSIAFNSDGSFCDNEQNEAWNFQVMLDEAGSFILNFNFDTKMCTSCEGYFHGYVNKKVFKRNLVIPEYIDGGLFIADEFDASLLGIDYSHIKKQRYFDEKKSLFAIGDIETRNQFYRFGIGQYIALDAKQNISAVIIKINNKFSIPSGT